ncbi:hypothetical protein EV643_10449 [Kribbella sp. VKM Ac-2527]|uniref:Uncharacterized protein n=2 Tax=Kribbella caucasensis TaxID=2512215 RepID=A0A4R6KL92_9ACTN|nr:hypothetical protein EV643_10449 [Kribbella sp. VKM Ac-2527]
MEVALGFGQLNGFRHESCGVAVTTGRGQLAARQAGVEVVYRRPRLQRLLNMGGRRYQRPLGDLGHGETGQGPRMEQGQVRRPVEGRDERLVGAVEIAAGLTDDAETPFNLVLEARP